MDVAYLLTLQGLREALGGGVEEAFVILSSGLLAVAFSRRTPRLLARRQATGALPALLILGGRHHQSDDQEHPVRVSSMDPRRTHHTLCDRDGQRHRLLVSERPHAKRP